MKITGSTNQSMMNDDHVTAKYMPAVSFVDTSAPLPPGWNHMVAKHKKTEKILRPTKADVLLGRGRPFQTHPGNQFMLDLVDQHKTRYLKAERHEKHAIVEGVMKAINARGGRFLSRVDYHHYWIEVTKSIAYRKVGHAFRSNARREENKRTKAGGGRAASPPLSPQAQANTMASHQEQGFNTGVIGPLADHIRAPRPTPALSADPLMTGAGMMPYGDIHQGSILPPLPPMDLNMPLGPVGLGPGAGLSSLHALNPTPLGPGVGLYPTPLMDYETPAMMMSFQRQRQQHRRLLAQHRLLSSSSPQGPMPNVPVGPSMLASSQGIMRGKSDPQPSSLLRSEIAELRGELATLRSELAQARRGQDG